MVLLPFFFFCKKEKNNIENTSQPIEQDVVIKVDTVEIYGTLLSADTNTNTPLVIIVAGSGPTDRDGNNKFGVTAKPYKILADSLIKYQIATFRYDKRAIGKSTKINQSILRFEHYIGDVEAIVDYFRANYRFSRIYVLGHSEGALIGAIAVQKSKVDGFISAAGTSKPAYEVLRSQLASNREIDTNELDRVLGELRKGKLTILNDKDLIPIFAISIQPYLISWFKYNPTDVYKSLKIPTLIVHGTTDIQIPYQQAQELHLATPNSRLSIIEGMNHIWKYSSFDRKENLSTYSNPKLPVCREFVEEIVKFIQK